MNLTVSELMPPAPNPEDWIVTVWIRNPSGLVERRRAATTASSAEIAKREALRLFKLHRGGPVLVDCDVRKRWQTGEAR